MSQSYRTNNVLVTMGGDFTYMQAGMWYANLDKLILYGNLKAAKDGLKINLFYSTPDCYLKAVKDANPKLPIKQDDFFPYASDPHSYWTGYFSSRPTVKYLEAQTNTYLQMVKQLHVLAHLDNKYIPKIDELRGVMGVMQHHDAVTGTEKQHVAKDYVRMVAGSANEAHDVIAAALNKMMAPSVGLLHFDRCQFNESSCHTSENDANLIVTVYNPLAWSYATLITIPVVSGDYKCQDGKGNDYEVQMMDIAESILNIPFRDSKAKREVNFIAELPALGYKSFYLTRTQTERARRNVHNEPLDIDKLFDSIKLHSVVNDRPVDSWVDRDVILIPDQPRNDIYKYSVNPDANTKSLLKSRGNDRDVEEFKKLFEPRDAKRSRHFDNPYSDMADEEMRMLADDPMVVTRYPGDEVADQTYRIDESQSVTEDKRTQVFNTKVAGPWYYPGAIGNNEISFNRSSGAYIFRPNAVTPTELTKFNVDEIDGPLFKEVRSTYPNNVYTAMKIPKTSKITDEFDWLVGPIPIQDGVGKEFIIKYDSSLTTNGECYTDSNGRQMLKRKLNRRPQWNLTLEEPVAGNYYPITSAIKIESSNGDFVNILTDRAVGGASLEEGSIELMVHRRLLHDDAFGVGEALNETVGSLGLVARGTHRLHYKDITFKQVLEMRLQKQVLVTDASGIDYDKFKRMTTEYSWLKRPLPEGIHILTVEPWKDGLILRLENYLETAERVDLTGILKGIDVKSVKESMLAGNLWSVDAEKWYWSKENEFSDDFNKEYGNAARPRAHARVKNSDDGMTVNIAGKQIRTFIINYDKIDL